MSTVTVLCPNGRRQQVKVQANTKILEIVEEVCKKQGYASNEHDLVHSKRLLDIALTFRLSGVPNNAQLELRKCESGPRQFADVIISLQLDDGTRLEPQTFKPDTATLLDVLEAYLGSSPHANEIFKQALDESYSVSNDSYPTFAYLNEQITGLHQIRNTTLKDLGVTNGRVIVRFDCRKMTKQQMENLNAQFDQKLKRKEKLDQDFEIKVRENQEREQLGHEAKSDSNVNVPCSELAPLPRAAHQPEKKAKMTEMAEYDIVKRNETRVFNQTPSEFANFKFPEETRGQNLNDLNELHEIERISKQPCDRKTMLLHLDNKKVQEESSIQARTSLSSKEKEEEEEEEFYKVTVDDLRFMLSDLKKAQSEEAPLMTRQMRELEQDRKAMRYAQIAIRIVFKNRQTLQGLFRPKEPVSVLYDFVRESLSSSQENTEQDLDFYLFTTPPKNILNHMRKTLFECQLCPAAMVYFKNKSDRVPRLRRELLDDVRSLDEADEIVHTHVHQQIRKVEHEGMNWLQKEQQLAQNLLKNTGLSKLTQQAETSSSSGGSGSGSIRAGPSRSDIDSEVNRRLERFLKGKK